MKESGSDFIQSKQEGACLARQRGNKAEKIPFDKL
jgi:hypothetical protein